MADADTVEIVNGLVEQISRMRLQIAAIEQQRQMQRLAAAPVLPGQKGDGRLWEGGIDRFTRAGTKMSAIYANIVGIERCAAGMTVEALGRVAAGAVSGLQKALGAAVDCAVRQMTSLELPAAGKLLSATVSPSGEVRARVAIDDRVVGLKVSEKVYPLLRIALTGDAVERIDFVELALA